MIFPCSIFKELMQNQDILKKLRMEINDKLGHTDFCGGNQVFDIKDLSSKNLPYLHGFIYEVFKFVDLIVLYVNIFILIITLDFYTSD